MPKGRLTRPSVRTVLRDGLVHIHIGKQYAGYVVSPVSVEERGDELIVRLKILAKMNLADAETQ